MNLEGKTTGCTAMFTEGGKVQAAHHVRPNETHAYRPEALAPVLVEFYRD
jgi:hypothetical protein